LIDHGGEFGRAGRFGQAIGEQRPPVTGVVPVPQAHAGVAGTQHRELGIHFDGVRDQVMPCAVRKGGDHGRALRSGRPGGRNVPCSGVRAMLSESYTTYIGLEAEASTLRVFELAVIPGILQTTDYAGALMRRRPGELPTETIDQRVDIRMARQQVLTGDDPARLRAVIDEAALRRDAGSPEVMKAQMEHLLATADLPRVELQVIPFSAGTHADTQGPFTILEFRDPTDLPAVYTENVAGEFFVERPEEVERFQLAFERLTAIAPSPEDSIAMIKAMSKNPN
jgi:Domain of unknown function (DUF5753)